jgi:cell division protein FtsB
MSTEQRNAAFDPLGLDRLGKLIDAAQKDPRAVAELVSAFGRTKDRYTAMKDRYRQLKATSRQLAEEVAWLRDQCDDFLMEQAQTEGESS